MKKLLILSIFALSAGSALGMAAGPTTSNPFASPYQAPANTTSSQKAAARECENKNRNIGYTGAPSYSYNYQINKCEITGYEGMASSPENNTIEGNVPSCPDCE